MGAMSASLRGQLKNNLIAIVSLSIAVSSLFYAVWRNDRSEVNRNIRAAAFEVLGNVGWRHGVGALQR